MPNFPIGANGRYVMPRLSREQLKAIYERNPCPEVRELLWEIKRLHILLMRAHQLQQVWDSGCTTSVEQVRDLFRHEMAGEPCIAEREKWEREFFE